MPRADKGAVADDGHTGRLAVTYSSGSVVKNSG